MENPESQATLEQNAQNSRLENQPNELLASVRVRVFEQAKARAEKETEHIKTQVSE